MGKRYYCDYCDKSFADNPVNRKTHLTGVTHLRSKKAHYDAFRDEKEILLEEQGKRPCKQFLSTGDCRFGERCQFSHLTNEDKAHLAESIRQKELQKNNPNADKASGGLKSALELWNQRRAEKEKTTDTVKKSTVIIPDYKLSENLQPFTNLPPSVLPPSREEILKSEYPDWGY